MPTNKVVLRTVDQFMADYTPIYQPVMPLFLGKSQAYSSEVGKQTFSRVNTVGDIRAKHITPKDTEIRQIAVNESSKTFKKYFLANQYINSEIQDQKGLEDVVKQVLDEHQKHMDDLFLLGEGTSASTMINNGLFWSDDANYTLRNSIAIAAGTAADHLQDLHAQVVAQALVANQVAGQKILIFYGSTMLTKETGVYSTSSAPWKDVLQKVLSGYRIVELPSAVTPSGTNGFIIANLDQVKLHYTVLPQLWDQGVNSEKMYAWFNFMMGSCMLEVLAQYGIIRQPTTFA